MEAIIKVKLNVFDKERLLSNGGGFLESADTLEGTLETELQGLFETAIIQGIDPEIISITVGEKLL